MGGVLRWRAKDLRERADHLESGGIGDPVPEASGFAARGHDALLSQHRQMLRKGRLRKADQGLELPHRPFAIDELLARVRALLRRGATESPGILQVDDLVLNPATRDVTRGGQRIELTVKEYALLEYLMRHSGRVLTRPMISEHVWNQDFDTFTNVIDVYVNHLRRKLEDGGEPRLIHAVRGVGYVMRTDDEHDAHP